MMIFGRKNSFPLILLYLMLPFASFAANIQSAGSGAWNDPATWSGGIPGTNDRVTILAGHTVFVPDNNLEITIKSLTVNAGAELLLGKFHMTVNQETDIHGTIRDPKRDGFTTFVGPANFHPGSIASFVFSYGTGGGVLFRNGLVNDADSLIFRKVQFETNDQSITGNSMMIVVESLEIAEGVTLTNGSNSYIWFNNARFDGLGAGALFRNEGTIKYEYRWTSMTVGQVDFAPAGNEFIYSNPGDTEVIPATYARLIIRQDSNSLFRNRYMIGDVTVNEYLYIQGNSRMEPKEFNLTVNGLTEIDGRFADPDFNGTDIFQDVILRGEIDGTYNGYGDIQIQGDLEIEGAPSSLTEANLTVNGTTTIHAGATLLINTNQGPRTFGVMNIEPGGTFDSRSDDAVVLAGQVNNNGSFYWKFGTLAGNIQHEGDTAWINKFEVSGTQAGLSGSKRIWIKDQILIDSASVLTNANTAGVYLYDRSMLIGLHPTAVFRNQGILHNQTDNTMMETGEIDADYPGSVFHYDRQGNQGQKLSPGRYRDVVILGGFEGGIRKVTFPSVDTMFVSNLFHLGEYIKFEPQTSSLVCTGHAIIRNSEIFDGDTQGYYEFNTIDVSGGKIAGGGNTFGRYSVKGEFQVASGDFEMQNGTIYVEGKTLVSPGQTLRVTTKSGTRDFGRTEISAGGFFEDNSGGGTIFFSGKVVNEGRFDVDFPVLRGGVDVQSDTTIMLKPVFQGNPSITGSRPLILTSEVGIDANTSVTNWLDSLVFQKTATLEGVDSSAIFVNRGKMYWERVEPFMTSGTFDATQGVNTVVYQITKGDLTIRPGVYWNLDLPTDSESNLPKRRLTTLPLTCLGNLRLDWNVELQPEKADIQIDGTAFIYGKIYDDEKDGTFTAARMVLGNALIDGQSSARFGTFVVEDELLVNFGESFWEKASLTVNGLLAVTDSAIFNLNTNTGKREFTDIYVASDGLLNENGNGQNVTVNGRVEVAGGTFQLSFGEYVFADNVLVSDEGVFGSNRTGSTFSFLDSITVTGTGIMQVPNGDLAVNGPLMGDGNLIIEGDLLIASNDTLVNQMTGEDAFMMRGTLNGEDNTAHFLNEGVFRFGARGNAPLMELGGTYDFLTYPDNWIIFDGGSSYQPVPAEPFMNIGFEGGSPKAIEGDSLKVFGNMKLEVEVRKDPDIFSTGVVLFVGDRDQTIDGDNVGVIENMVVRKNGGSLTVNTGFGIKEGLIMKQGILTSKPGIVGISGGGFIQESDYSYIIGKVGSERSIGQGQTREFGGMGISIKPEGANMGPTLVYRVTGEALVPGQVERYYEIYATNNADLDATIEFGYHERELNGAVETDLQVTHREPGGDFVVLGGGTYRVSNFVRKTGIDRLGVVSLVPSTMAVNAYPSPFVDDRFTISFTLDEDDPFVNVRIFDLAGREWEHRTVEAVAGRNDIELTDLNLAGGTYIVRIVSRGWAGFHYVQKQTD